ncbi:hypothetical protein EJP617_16510 [Erwinia sp. Ejp617]|nr:hypothetical protein EJP617_16510 [Erwinia sp. Ejp617]
MRIVETRYLIRVNICFNLIKDLPAKNGIIFAARTLIINRYH